jgi:phosphoribosylformimino-5-aminoimidazole carboxamide ribotide isomerase
MLLIPAIDLKDGKCVRLEQGDMKAATTFGDNPAAMARRWLAAGARRLHLVDLNGAFAGKPVNESAVKAILREVGDQIPVQLGGGLRDLDTIERFLDDGLSYVIIGTAAVKSPGFLKDACSAFGGHVIVGLDAKDGKVATDGWSKLTGHVIDLAKFEMASGRDLPTSGDSIPASMSGPPSSWRRRCDPRVRLGRQAVWSTWKSSAPETRGHHGVICGRAICNGALDFAAAQKRADELNGPQTAAPRTAAPSAQTCSPNHHSSTSPPAWSGASSLACAMPRSGAVAARYSRQVPTG